MKTIKKKIAVPFLLIIIMIPFTTMVLFNAAVGIYMDRMSREELKNNAASIEILIRQQLMDGASDKIADEFSDPSNTGQNSLQEDLRQAKLSLLYSVKNMNIEFLLLSPEGKVLFPKSFNNSFLAAGLLNQARSELDKVEADAVIEFRSGREKYFASWQPLTDRPDTTQLIFISSGSPADRMVRVVNLILLCITVFAVGIGSVIALIISDSISRPVSRLSGYAKRIGENEYLSLEDDASSEEIHELTKSMNEMSDRLKSYDAAQKSFLQNASHELRTPLMSIQGYAEGMARGVFPDTVKTAGIICEESRRLNSLVEELLTLSRIENKNYKGELVRLNTTGVVMDCVQRIDGYALKEGKTVKLNVLNETMPAEIDDALLSQAVINIVSNCIKYAEKEITVSLFTEGQSAVIKIEDDGAGISDKDLPHIFERFYKGEKGDFGLGLSIAKSAVEFMNGKIAASNGSCGAVFTIRLPLSLIC